MQTDWGLTINQITQYGLMKSEDRMGFHHKQAGINLHFNGVASVSIPVCTLTSYPYTTIDLTVDIVSGALPLKATSNSEILDPHKPDQASTFDPANRKVFGEIVGVGNASGKVYGKATGLYSKHCKYSEQWNPWHSCQFAHNFQQAQLGILPTEMWLDWHLWYHTGTVKIQSIQSADTLPKLLSDMNFNLGDDSWNWGWLTYRLNSIPPGYIQIYTVSLSRSLISAIHRLYSGGHHLLPLYSTMQ